MFINHCVSVIIFITNLTTRKQRKRERGKEVKATCQWNEMRIISSIIIEQKANKKKAKEKFYVSGHKNIS